MAEFKQASKQQSKLRCAVFGPSGSGKTYSSLRMATGMVGEAGRIALIDTERGSASLYADRFRFDVCDLGENRTIDDYCAAIDQAAEAGYDALIIDSLTHAWQELLTEVDLLARAKYSNNTWAAWSEGTPKQRRFIDALLGFPGHIFATIRTKTEWDQQKDERGRIKPVRIGLVPQQGKGIEYEFTFLLQIDTDHIATAIKDRTGKFQDRLIECPGEEFGAELAAWLAEGTPAEVKPYKAAVDRAAEQVDRELGSTGFQPVNTADLNRLNQLIYDHNLTADQQAAWCAHFGVASLDKLAQQQIDAIVAKIETTATGTGA